MNLMWIRGCHTDRIYVFWRPVESELTTLLASQTTVKLWKFFWRLKANEKTRYVADWVQPLVLIKNMSWTSVYFPKMESHVVSTEHSPGSAILLKNSYIH